MEPDYRKYLSLVVLVLQNTALVLTLRYSRTVEGEIYLASTAVVLTELLKFAVCFCMVFYDNQLDLGSTLGLLKSEIVDNYTETIKVSVPSILYTIQNNLLYVALTYLDAATFQVTYQLKILTTALFSVLLLGRKLDTLKWVSLVVLTVAVALVQLPQRKDSSDEFEEEDHSSSLSSSLIGLIAVLLACVSSGFSGVYIEKILKGSETSMWIRNIQLSLLSFVFGLFGVLVMDWSAVREDGFFQGYSVIVGIVICLQAAGGLIVSAVMKYADNILKGFAASFSIVLSSVVSYFVLKDFNPTWFFVMGAALVLIATSLYTLPPNTQQKLTQTILPVTTQNIEKDP